MQRLRSRQESGRQSAFTIVELIVVIVVIAMLATIVTISYGAWRNSVVVAQVKNDLNAAASTADNNKAFAGGGYDADILDGFVASDGVLVEPYEFTDTSFCIDGSANEGAIVYHIDSDNKTQGPEEGWCADRPAQTPPGQPTISSLTTVSTTAMNLVWDTVSSVDSYLAQCATDEGFISNMVSSSVTPPTTSYSLTGLLANTAYYCRVRGVNTHGSGSWSANATGNTNTVTPTGLAVTTVSETRQNYSWSAVPGATSYDIQRAKDSGMSLDVTTTSVSSNSGSFKTLDPSTYYHYRVRAVGPNGAGSYSAIVNSGTFNDWSVYSKFATVGDWNLDGKNDIVGYRSNGYLFLHLGTGGPVFESGRYLGNIGTIVRNMMSAGILPSQTSPALFYVLTDGKGYTLQSNGSTGIAGAPVQDTVVTNWTSYSSVFSAPKFYTVLGTQTTITGKISGLYFYSLNSSGSASTYLGTFGSGWDATFPGDRVFGLGDWNTAGGGDIAGISSGGTMTAYPGTGTGTTGTTWSLGTGWLNDIVFGGYDYSGDAYPDILRYVTTSGVLYMYTGNGSTGFTLLSVPVK